MAKNRNAALREKHNAAVQARKQQAEARMQSQMQGEKERQMQYNAQYQPGTATVQGGASPEQMAKLDAYGQFMNMNSNDPNAPGLVQTARTGLNYPNEQAQMADQYIQENMLQYGPPTQQVAALAPMGNQAADPNSLKQKLANLLAGQ